MAFTNGEVLSMTGIALQRHMEVMKFISMFNMTDSVITVMSSSGIAEFAEDTFNIADYVMNDEAEVVLI